MKKINIKKYLVFEGSIETCIEKFTENLKQATVSFSFLNVIESLNTESIVSPYSKKQRDKLFLAKGITIPRFKMKNLSEKEKIRAVRDIDKCDYLVISDSTLAKVSELKFYYNISFSDFKNAITPMLPFMEPFYRDKVETVFNTYTEEKILIKSSDNRSFFKDSLKIFTDLPINFAEVLDDNSKYNKFNIVYDTDLNFVEKLLSNTVPVIHENEVIALINGVGCLTIDEEMYEQLKTLFESTDNENHTIAMEIMANCNYRKSLFYLMTLFREFNPLIKVNSAKNHVNFKCLMNFLDIDFYSVLNIDHFVKQMLLKKVIDKDVLDKLCRKYETDLYNNASNYLQIKTVTFATEVLEELNENFTVSLIDDFVPVTEEPKVESQEELSAKEELSEELTSDNENSIIWG